MPTREEFVQWLSARCAEGERILETDLAQGPREHFTFCSSNKAHEFYEKIERLRRWRASFRRGITNRVRACDDLVAEFDRRLDIDKKLLVVTITNFNNRALRRTYDLSLRHLYSNGDGWMELQDALSKGVEDPLWIVSRSTMAMDLRGYRAMLLEQLEELDLVPSKQELMKDQPISITINAPLHGSAINVGSGVQVNAFAAQAAPRDVFLELDRQFADLRERLLTLEDSAEGMGRATSELRTELADGLREIIARIKLNATSADLRTSDDVRVLVQTTISEMNASSELRPQVFKDPIVQNVVGSGAWDLIMFIIKLIERAA